MPGDHSAGDTLVAPPPPKSCCSFMRSNAMMHWSECTRCSRHSGNWLIRGNVAEVQVSKPPCLACCAQTRSYSGEAGLGILWLGRSTHHDEPRGCYHKKQCHVGTWREPTPLVTVPAGFCAPELLCGTIAVCRRRKVGKITIEPMGKARTKCSCRQTIGSVLRMAENAGSLTCVSLSREPDRTSRARNVKISFVGHFRKPYRNSSNVQLENIPGNHTSALAQLMRAIFLKRLYTMTQSFS